LNVAITFAIASLAWVFFRAATLPEALAYLANLTGLGTVQPGAALLPGILYQPYYLISMALAAGITWCSPQTWDFTRHLTWPKALWATALLLVSIGLLMTQSYNPFIYFIF
jgi:alginate O-acetyltransferase complex protein AlgI